MAKSLNKCQFIGNLGRDPEVKHLPNGAVVCNLALACNESWKDKNTGEKQEKTEWIQLVAWQKLAEICGQYLHKGAKIYVEGKFTTEKWQDTDGKDRYSTKVIINEMLMLSAPQDGQQENPSQKQPQAQQPEPVGGIVAGDDFDDGIPF